MKEGCNKLRSGLNHLMVLILPGFAAVVLD